MDNFRSTAIMLLLLFPSLTCGADGTGAVGFAIRQTNSGVEVSEGGSAVLTYQTAAKQIDGDSRYRRAHYVHPLYDLNGNVITEDFPTDHLHHRGVFWAWHQVIANEMVVGDAWICQDFDWDVREVTSCHVGRDVIIRATAVWSSSKLVDQAGNAIPLARDEVEIHLYPRDENFRAIDFTIRLTALVDDLKIGGSDDTKGYGGFSARIRMPDDLRFVSAAGPIEPTVDAIAAGDWMMFQSNDFSYAIFASQHNPGDSGKWILRQKRSMQNPVYPGATPVAVDSAEPTVLRYRLVILEGGRREYDLDAMSRQFQASQTIRATTSSTVPSK